MPKHKGQTLAGSLRDVRFEEDDHYDDDEEEDEGGGSDALFVRSAFEAEQGHRLLAADFSHQEMRFAAFATFSKSPHSFSRRQ